MLRTVAALIFSVFLAVSFMNGTSAYAETDVTQGYKPTAAQLKKAKNFAARYAVRTLELALTQLDTPERMVAALYENFSMDDKIYVLRRSAAIPAVYRTTETELAFATPSFTARIYFKDVYDGKLYFDGQPWVYKSKLSIKDQVDRWGERLQKMKSQQGDKYADVSLRERKEFLAAILSAVYSGFIPESQAAPVRRTLSLVERAAVRAAEKAGAKATAESARIRELEIAVKTLQEAAAAAKPPVEASVYKKAWNALVTTVGIGTGMGIVNIGPSMIQSYVKTFACDYFKATDESCLNTRIAIQAAEEKLSSAPVLKGGQAESLAAKAAKFFKIKDIKCRVKIPEDALIMKLDLKKPDGTVIPYEAQMQWGADGKATGGVLKDDASTTPVAKYNFTDGRLIEVCVAKTKTEISNSNEPLPKLNRCIKDSGGDEEEYALHNLLTQSIDLENQECGKKAARKIQDEMPPQAPSQSPVTVPGAAVK